MKRIFNIFSMFLIVMLLSVSVMAATVYTEGTLYYTIEDKSVTITGCFSKDDTVTVPPSIAGNPVNTIAKGAFSNTDYVKTVNLPDTIMTVEEGAFATGITVNFSSNVKKGDDNSQKNEEPDSTTENNNSGTVQNNDEKSKSGQGTKNAVTSGKGKSTTQFSGTQNTEKTDENTKSRQSADSVENAANLNGADGNTDAAEKDLEDTGSSSKKKEKETTTSKTEKNKGKAGIAATVGVVIILLVGSVAVILRKRYKK